MSALYEALCDLAQARDERNAAPSGEEEPMNARHKASIDAQVLEQLQLAHQIILHALAIMTADQKREWAKKNADAGMDTEDGITGFHARKAVIERATGNAS